MTTLKAAPKNSGKFGKGNPGKPKGATNHINRDLKEMILKALSDAGGADYLLRQARKKNPAPFLQLVAKVLPMTVAGDPNAPLGLTVNIVRH